MSAWTVVYWPVSRQGVSPSTLVLQAMASAIKLAANAFWAAWVRRADQRPTSPAIVAARSGGVYGQLGALEQWEAIGNDFNAAAVHAARRTVAAKGLEDATAIMAALAGSKVRAGKRCRGEGAGLEQLGEGTGDCHIVVVGKNLLQLCLDVSWVPDGDSEIAEPLDVWVHMGMARQMVLQ
ncbi:unnamed protein product [Durusdinium trenchii]|uniref:Uncharacterized protein n=1 Tax=Durusdinium trenchii TaxID=1381693 RepID=A0ABP0J047_9DINO